MKRNFESQDLDWESDEDSGRNKKEWKRSRREARRVKEDERSKFDAEDSE